MRVLVRRLRDDAALPGYAHEGDAGLDLVAAEDVTLKPGERAPVATGVAVAIPNGYAGFVHARSGRALREGLALVNAPGVIDSGYRGEIKVIAVNLDAAEPIYIRKGEKIAQLVVQPVVTAHVEETNDLPPTARGARGFGSTGR